MLWAQSTTEDYIRANFWKTIWLMMLHDNTNFGSKSFSGSEDITWTNIHWHFEILLWPCPWTQQSTFSTNTLAYDNVLSDQVWWQKDQQFKRCSRNHHILIIWALAVTLALTIANQSFCMTLWLIMMYHNTRFGNKMFGGLEDTIWTNINILTLSCDLDPECSNPFFFFFICIIRSSLVAKESTVQII